MDRTLKIELALDLTSWDALPQYRKIIQYLMDHPDTTEEDKLGLEFCDLSSKRLQGLQQYYKGVFKVKNTADLRTMKDYVQKLVDTVVPGMTFGYFEKDGCLIVITDGVMRIKTPEKDNNTTSVPTTEVMEQRARPVDTGTQTYGIEEELDPLFETEMVLMAKEMEAFCSPVKQVQTGTMSSVASLVTRQSTDAKKDKTPVMTTEDDKETESDVMVHAPAVTPVKERNIGKQKENENRDSTSSPSQNSGPVLSQGGTLLKPGIFDLIPDNIPENQVDTEETEVNSHSVEKGSNNDAQMDNIDGAISNTTSDSHKHDIKDKMGFTTVLTGIKPAQITTNSNANPIPTSNSYDVLRDDDDEEEGDNHSETTEEKSFDLLASTRATREKETVEKAQNNIIQEKKTMAKKGDPKKPRWAILPSQPNQRSSHRTSFHGSSCQHHRCLHPSKI